MKKLTKIIWISYCLGARGRGKAAPAATEPEALQPHKTCGPFVFVNSQFVNSQRQLDEHLILIAHLLRAGRANPPRCLETLLKQPSGVPLYL